MNNPWAFVAESIRQGDALNKFIAESDGGQITPDWVESALAVLAVNTADFERAHIFEDDLHARVLRAIAEGRCVDPARCADLALRTKAVPFVRHHA